MSTILEADATGALSIPPALLPHSAPGRRYHVDSSNGQLLVKEECTATAAISAEDREAWLKKLDAVRARGATGKVGVPLQEILDDIR